MKKTLVSLVVISAIFACKKEEPFDIPFEEEVEIDYRITYTKDGFQYKMNIGEDDVQRTGGSSSVFFLGGNQQDYHYFFERSGLVRNPSKPNMEKIEINFAYYPVDKDIYEEDLSLAIEEVAFVGPHPFSFDFSAGFILNYENDGKAYSTEGLMQSPDAYVEVLDAFMQNENELFINQKVFGHIPSCQLLNVVDSTDTLVLENIDFELVYSFN